MSPLWRDEVGAYLSPHRLCLVRMRRGARPKPVAEHAQRCEDVRSDSWEAPLAALAAARLGSQGWDRVHSVRIGVDWMRELRRLQTFGRLARHRPEEGQVYVDAPHSWRELASATASGADGGGLQWLDEADTPITTLERLGRARRMAA